MDIFVVSLLIDKFLLISVLMIKWCFIACFFAFPVMGQIKATVKDKQLIKYIAEHFPGSVQIDGRVISTEATKTCIELDISNRGITSLEGLEVFPSLRLLNCSGNSLIRLDELPASLEVLNCQDNALTELPKLPLGLRVLRCGYNRLTELRELPSYLEELDCNSNGLNDLPDLPFGLRKLNCAANRLTDLPLLPKHLEELGCAENQLTMLPSLPMTLKLVWVDGNSLTCLPRLPENVGYLSCGRNQITCLPKLGTEVYFLNLDNNPLTCLANKIALMEDTQLNLPICGTDFSCVCEENKENATAISGKFPAKSSFSTMNNSTDEIKFYPNPVKSSFTVEAREDIDFLSVTDINGQVQLELIPGTSRVDLDFSSLNNGIYFIQVSVNGKQTVGKLMKVE
jgi:Leucine-rich repeat (LRR) protein